MHKDLQGVVMSLDGVLFNSYPLLKQTYDTLLQQHQMEPNDYFYELYLDAGLHQMERSFFHFYQYQPHQQALRQAYVQQLVDLTMNPTALSILEKAQAKGYKIGFTSGLSRQEAAVLIEKLPDWLQSVPIVYYNEVIEGKPEKSTNIKLSRLMGISEYTIASIDASLNGVLGAYMANMKPIYVELFTLRTLKVQKYSQRQVESLDDVLEVLHL